ncbi:hypothetical protein J7643_04830 [bacterium]|nr:hypothetical protein [bacterium]
MSKSFTLSLFLLASVALTPGIAQAAPVTPKIFAEKGCIQCHSVSAYGLEGSTAGPDLSHAYSNVPKRVGVPLEQFMKQPTGTMEMVLTSMITLTDAESQGIVRLLKSAGQKKPKGK